MHGPLDHVKSLFQSEKQTFRDIGVKINPSVEGLGLVTVEELGRRNERPLLSLEFCWLPRHLVESYNSSTATEREEVLVKKVWTNCPLNCKGCFVKNPALFGDHDLLYPEQIMTLIEEAVQKLGAKSIKYLGPTEFFRDPDAFEHLDRFEELGVTLGIFAKDPMFGSDKEVERVFGHIDLKTSEEFVAKLSKYRHLRILYNFRSFRSDVTNDLVRGGYQGKEDFPGNYHAIQTRSLHLLYEYLVRQELEAGREARLMMLNAPITPNTVMEALEIFKHFTDRGVTVCSTASMQSGCGSQLYVRQSPEFVAKLARYYAKAMQHSVRRGMIPRGYYEELGPSPYAGIAHCIQMCSGVIIRETGQLMRCPGADHAAWCDHLAPEELLKNGLAWAWKRTKNHAMEPRLNHGCLAKPDLFTAAFLREVMRLYRQP